MDEMVYSSIHSFCMSKNLRDPNVERYMNELNEAWIDTSNDPEGLRRHLDRPIAGSVVKINGVVPWITSLALEAAKINKPVMIRDGTVFVMKSEELGALIHALGTVYEDIITHTLLDDPHNLMATRKLEMYQAMVRFLWALLGLSPNIENFAHFLDRSHHIDIRLPELLKASAHAKQPQVIPKQVVELDDLKFKLLTKPRRNKSADGGKKTW